jgi:phenylalanyl-tRNA synthetase beta chain
MKTAEQEAVSYIGAHFEQVCAARVVSVEPLSGANVKAVLDTGRYGARVVVCGAPNCRPGILSAYVPPGVTLGGVRIERAVISGVESDGMLAAPDELGISRDHSGILELGGVVPGDPIPGCAPDAIIEVDNKSITHRPDLWGHHGMAREVAAILDKPLREPVNLALLPAGDGAVAVDIEDYTLCPRYSALVFDNVTVGPSPLWLQYRLQSIGLNPINNIVDVTNYVMAEIAQPMHAFDLDALKGDRIIVRAARSGERLVALNGEEYELDPLTLVIADTERAVAIGGVIGGFDTGITDRTTRIILESANFHPGNIRKTSSRLKLRTDASMRFEKAQDPHNTVRGLARALELLQKVSPGIRLVGGLVDNRAPIPNPPQIRLPLSWLNRKLGRGVEPAEVRRILASLQFGVTEDEPGVFTVTVPSWRATKDVTIKDDLVEEVGRMVGYDSIQPCSPLVPSAVPPASPERLYHHEVRRLAASQGFTEVYNYSFVSEEQAREFGLDPARHLAVTNPIASDQGLMRMSLVPNLVRNIRDNARHFESFRLFEIGNEIHKRPDDLPHEIPHLLAAVVDKQGDGQVGLFECKRLAECLLPGSEVTPAEPVIYEHPARTWTLRWQGKEVGRIFELHPDFFEGRAALLDVNLQLSFQLRPGPARYKPLRRFPASSFDLSIVAGARELVGGLQAMVAQHAGELLESIVFVRQYSGPPLPPEKKSVSFRITVGAPDRTLSAGDVAQARSRIIEAVKAAGYELRL